MISSAERDGLIDLLDDLEYFLEVADRSIEEREEIIRELVESFEAITNAAGVDQGNAKLQACRAVIAKARALVAW
jgi:hypothetical protein